MHQGFAKIVMAYWSKVFDRPLAHQNVTGVKNGFAGIQSALETSQSNHSFEDGAGSIVFLCRSVNLRAQLGVLPALPLPRWKALDGMVWVQGRRRCQGQYVPGIHVHHDDRAARARTEDRQGALSGLLKLEVNREHNVLARLGWTPDV